MAPTRTKILAFLEKRGSASAIELSHALQLTPANIRHHLRVLQKEGVVIAIRVDRTHERGRPAYLFALREQQKAHNLDRLCGAFLQHLRAAASPHEKDSVLRSIAQQMAAMKPTSPALTLTQRLMATMKTLNEMSYKASWEAHRESPTIKFAHCPYASIIDSFPELCQIDQYLLEALMQCSIETVSTQESTPTGEFICRFRLRQPKPS